MLDKLRFQFKKSNQPLQPQQSSSSSQPIRSDRLQELTQRLEERLQQFYKEKGNTFEAYIVKKFDRRYFTLIHWRSDKGTKGVYAESNKYPDLVFEFKVRQSQQYFAIECKWRQEWYKGGINWANEHQIANYREYAQRNNMPVFVVIGVNGMPEKPQNLFIIPLNRLKYPYAKATYLEQFRRKDNSRNFFFDAKQANLR